MKPAILLLAIAALGSVLIPAAVAASAAEPLFADPVIATGKGVQVKRSDLENAFVAYRANLAARGQTIPEDKRMTAEAQLLDRIIVTQLLVQQATPEDKAKAGEAAEKFFDAARQRVASDDDFLRQLRAMGLTAKQFTNRVVEQALSEAVITREIKNKIPITDTQIQKFYQTNSEAFFQPELARASHIMFSIRDPNTLRELTDKEKAAKEAKARDILARVRQGEDFTELALQFSEDPGVKENKGEYKFSRARDDKTRAMGSAAFEAAAFSLRPGQTSDIISTEFGYHIIRLHEIIPPRKLALDEEIGGTTVRDRIKELLAQQELVERMPAFFANLKKDAEVKVLDESLAEALARSSEKR